MWTSAGLTNWPSMLGSMIAGVPGGAALAACGNTRIATPSMPNAIVPTFLQSSCPKPSTVETGSGRSIRDKYDPIRDKYCFALVQSGGARQAEPQYSPAVFEKVLIANRGEIAIRVARALKEMGIGSIAVYSELDRDAPHVREADEAFLLGPPTPAESYLNVEKILEVASTSGAEAIHPGYGFLAENAPFAAAVEKAKLTWIGPPPKAIEAMGSKTEARQIMQKAGVPIVPGGTSPVKDVAAAKKQAEEIGYPIACKAAGGGGGKGFRVAMSKDEMEDAFEGASREGEKFFSDPTVYLERYLEDPRHVEVQVLADSKGNVIHLGERDCSIQRRHQKLIEESPGPLVDDEMREKIGRVGVAPAKGGGYHSAGTIEGLFVKQDDGPDEYFFLEMNTRVQVEHCVTEATTGIDIVRE